MHLKWTVSAAIALACSLTPALAQDAASRAASSKITLTGCVERADQVLARENLGTTVDSLTYVLVKAKDGKSQESAKTYRLDVDSDTMNPHVGHEVEIVGAIAQAAADAPVGTAGRANAADPNGAAAPALVKVESVKMLSSTCGREQ
jgi:hypothetical protein